NLSVNTTDLTTGDHTVELTVTGQCASATGAATLTVQPITSATAPTDLETCQGQDANFEIVASGVGPFEYQWRLDGHALGTNGPSLTLPTADLDLGDHALAVEVRGQCGPALTNAATLTLQELTSANGPTDLLRYPGQTASFSTSASGSGPFTYQWRKDGLEIPGATDSILTIASVTNTDAGTYSVVVTGPCSTLTNSATLTVIDCLPVTAGTPQLNPQSGLLVQAVQITNSTKLTFPALRVSVSGLPQGVAVYNSSGDLDGIPFVQYNQSLGPDQVADLTIEYYV